MHPETAFRYGLKTIEDLIGAEVQLEVHGHQKVDSGKSFVDTQGSALGPGSWEAGAVPLYASQGLVWVA